MTTRAPAYTSSRPLDAPPRMPSMASFSAHGDSCVIMIDASTAAYPNRYARRCRRMYSQNLRLSMIDRIGISTERTTKLSRRLYHRVSAPHSRTQEPMRWNGVVVILALVAGGTLPGNAGAEPAYRSVGVVDFNVTTPLGAFSGLVPERFAADDFSKMLSGVAAGRFAVIPRSAMGRAEAALNWRDADVLNFDRLRALAQAAGADWLLVGWISHLVITTG